MNLAVGDLLDHVDEWKFCPHTSSLKPAASSLLLKQLRQRARVLGLTVPEPEQPAKRLVRRR
jgi:hypothetical protein